MNSLDEAWRWYDSTKKQVWRMQRLAQRHWDELPWTGKFGRDNAFRTLEADDVVSESLFTLTHLDDLAIVVLFSVFEAIVRQHIAEEVRQEAVSLQHPALRQAAADVLDAITQGSFFRVTEPFKQNDGDLIEEVNQVRHYRNWVAHGKRGDRPATVDPQMAHVRLARFLQLVGCI